MPPMSSAARVLCPSLLRLPAVPGSATAAAVADGWSASPSGGGRPSFCAEGAPGSVVRDAVSVTNRSAGPITVRPRGTDAPIVFADRAVRIPARTRADVPFTVTVPAGDRGAETVARGPDGGVRSVGLRLRVTVPELSAPTVEHIAPRADHIAYDLINRGTTALVRRLAVRADGLLGPVPDRAPRILPLELPRGRRLHLTEPWPGRPDRPDRPALDAVDVRLTVRVTAAGGAGDTAGAAVMAVRRRRRRGHDGAAPESPCTEAELTGATT